MIELLNEFLAVAASGNFTQVAKAQGVAVSSVTRKIEKLEAELGTKLFNRGTRRVLLTDAGTRFVPRAQSILADFLEAKESLAALRSDPRGVITVTAPATFGRIYVAPSVVTFVEKYPLMQVDLEVSDQNTDFVQRVDVAVRIGALPDSDLLASRLASIRLVACASPRYIASKGRPETPDDLLAHNCIDVATGASPSGTWCFEGWNGNRPYDVKGNIRVNDKGCMRDLALAGGGIIHIASWIVNEDILAGRLIELFPNVSGFFPKGSERAVFALRMRGRSHDLKAGLFIEHLRRHLAERPGHLAQPELNTAHQD